MYRSSRRVIRRTAAGHPGGGAEIASEISDRGFGAEPIDPGDVHLVDGTSTTGEVSISETFKLTQKLEMLG